MKQLLSALCEAKKEIGAITKDSKNPFFKSNYFDINKLIQQVEPILSKHKLVLLQPITNGQVLTQIYHVDTGDVVGSSMTLIELNDPQKMGSQITYYRRYTLQSLLALEAEDDDGNSASGKVKQKPAPKQKPAEKQLLKEGTPQFANCIEAMVNKGKTLTDIEQHYRLTDAVVNSLQTEAMKAI